MKFPLRSLPQTCDSHSHLLSTYGETKAQRGEVSCPRSHSTVPGLGSKSTSEPVTVTASPSCLLLYHEGLRLGQGGLGSSVSISNLEYIVFSVLSLLALILKRVGSMSFSSLKPTCYTVYYLFILVIAITYLALIMHQGLHKTLHRIFHVMRTATE